MTILLGALGIDRIRGTSDDEWSDEGTGSNIIDAWNDDIRAIFSDPLTGSAGADIMNGAQGNDTLDPKEGNDLLTGAEGSDLFVFKNGYGDDIITDYEVGVDDPIDIRDFGFDFTIPSNFTNFIDTKATDQSHNVMLALDNDDSVTLWGVNKDDLSATTSRRYSRGPTTIGSSGEAIERARQVRARNG